MARNLLALCGLAGGMLAGGSLLCGQDQPATGEVRLSLLDHVAAALESGANDEAKSALVKRYAETADMPIASRMQCLALLCREPTVAYRLKEELERVAEAIPLSLRLYAAIMGPGQGWNYRDQATMFVELCHPPARLSGLRAMLRRGVAARKVVKSCRRNIRLEQLDVKYGFSDAHPE